jgi:hypothetical protein
LSRSYRNYKLFKRWKANPKPKYATPAKLTRKTSSGAPGASQSTTAELTARRKTGLLINFDAPKLPSPSRNPRKISKA